MTDTDYAIVILLVAFVVIGVVLALRGLAAVERERQKAGGF